jgi:hypothetical protein
VSTLFGLGTFPPANLNGSGGNRDLTGSGDNAHYAMGLHVVPAVNGSIPALYWFCPTVQPPTNPDFGAGLFRANGALGLNSPVTSLVWKAFTAPGSGVLGTWVTLTLDAPISVSAGDHLYAVVRTNRYAFAGKAFDTGSVVNGNLTGPASIVGGAAALHLPNGCFLSDGAGASFTPPQWDGDCAQFNQTYYGIDVEFTPDGAPPASSGRWGIPL